MRFQQLTALIFVTAVTLPSHAALITWSGPINSEGAGDVVTEGSSILAENLAATTDAAPEIALIGDGDIEVEFETVDGVLGSDSNGALAGSVTLTGGYNTLLDTFGAADDAIAALTLGDGDLTGDAWYVIQAWFTDLNEPARTMILRDDILSDDAVTLAGTGSGLGQFAVGVFLAGDSGSQTLSLSASSGVAALSALQIRELHVDSGIDIGPTAAGILNEILEDSGLLSRVIESSVSEPPLTDPLDDPAPATPPGTAQSPDQGSVPIPTTLALLGLGLAGLMRDRSRRLRLIIAA